jgi:hypothetical protein
LTPVHPLSGKGFIVQSSYSKFSVDAANDVASLKAEGSPRGGTALPVAASRGVKLGGTVATVGFPNPALAGQGFAPSEGDK